MNNRLSFLDAITLVSFLIGLQNLEMNIDQNDMQEQTQTINKTADALVTKAIADIHQHLQEQDEKIDMLVRLLNENHRENKPVHQ